MIVGIILGALFASLFSLIIHWVLFEYDLEKYTWVVIIAIIILGVFVGAKIGIAIDKSYYETKIEQFKMSKQTIETSIINDKLSGLERVELVQLAVEENKWLAEIKVDVTKWWYFHLDESLLEDLQPINFEGGNEDE